MDLSSAHVCRVVSVKISVFLNFCISGSIVQHVQGLLINNNKQNMWHDTVHRGLVSIFQNWAVDNVMKHSISWFVWSKRHLPTLFGEYLCCLFSYVFLCFLFPIFAGISVSHLRTLASMDHIMSYIIMVKGNWSHFKLFRF